MPKLIEGGPDNIRVELELHGCIRRDPRAVAGRYTRDLAVVTKAIQMAFPRLCSLEFQVNAPVRFSVLPAKGDTLESIGETFAMMRASLVAEGILSERLSDAELAELTCSSPTSTRSTAGTSTS